MSPIKAIIANVIFMLIIWGIGYPLTNWLNKGRKANFFPAGIIAPVIGFNLFSLGFLLFSCSGIFRYISPSIMVFPLIFYALTVMILYGKWRFLKAGFTKWPYIIFFISGLLLLGAALSPPLGWDEMVYHQPIVRRWMQDGFPNIYFDLPYSGFPSSNSFLFWFLSETGGIIAPRLFIWTCWLFNSCLLFRLLTKQGLRNIITSVLVIAFSFSPVMIMVTSDAYVEMILILNLTTVLYLFNAVNDHKNSNGNDLRQNYKLALIFAILAAGQASIKLTGVVLFVVPFFLLFFHTPRKGVYDWPVIEKKFRVVLFMAVCWALLVIPFYIRPLLITGNPFYPYFSWVFTDSQSTIAMSEFHHAIGSARYGLRSIPMFFVAPFALIFENKTFEGTLGWQLAVMLLVFIWAMVFKREKENRLFSSMIVFLYVFWFFTAQQARFLLPAVLILYYYAGLQIKGLKKIYLKIIGGLLAILTIISLPFSSSGYYYFSWKQLYGKLKFDDYFYTGTGDYYLPAIDAVKNMTPKEAKILLLFEHRLLYFPRTCRIGTPYFQEQFFTPINSMGSDTEIIQKLKRDNFTHILVALKYEGPDGHKDYFKKNRELMTHIKNLGDKRKINLIWKSQNHLLFRIE
jgi:hypothetical protein